MKNKIAIIAVTYNRIDSLKRLLKSLELAQYGTEHPTLIISIDKSKTDCIEVFAEQYKWPLGEKIVKKHETNMGLRNHMMSLGKWFEQFDTLIILEDDIIVSPCYYYYSRIASEKYWGNMRIAGISLYGFEMNYHTCTPFHPMKSEYDVYLMNTAMSWGEVWMKPQWLDFYKWYNDHQDFDFNAKLPNSLYKWGKSWLKYHTRYCIEHDYYFVYPYSSLSSNCSDSGTHNSGKQYNAFQVNLQRGYKQSYIFPDDENDLVKYDGFFENKMIYNALNMDENELCIDLYGIRKNQEMKKFWLTTCNTDLPIIKSFSMSYKPMEINVILQIAGNDIFLYDTNCSIQKVSPNHKEMLQRYNIDDITIIVRKYGILRATKDFVCLLFNRIKNVL